MPTIKTYIVDAFTNEQFKGNPAAVCLLEDHIDENLMLLIAQEFNLSETAFVKAIIPNKKYSIRFFSPKMEIPLCGHATLASSKILFEKLGLKEIDFTNVEDLNLHIRKDKDDIIMEFPVYETVSTEAPPALLTALGVDRIINSCYNKETNILLLEIDNTILLADLNPDFQALVQSHNTINGVLVTAKSTTDGYDFHSRYFWPWSGTNEDPVTGGTHTFLAKYWSERLGKRKMKSFQSSKRTGFMEVEMIDQHKFLIKSEAVIVFEGVLTI